MALRTRRKGLGPSPDLPGLFPTHDGSYGINTLINIDTESKRGQKPNAAIAQEQSDDKKWVKLMKGKVAKKYGMNSNLKQAIVESCTFVKNALVEFLEFPPFLEFPSFLEFPRSPCFYQLVSAL
ncbi:hypothetical protein ONZ43_g741 [Nemania bipapillata]|uniref:Uncharacterized protein n=1 Tax=Nemania bipapillata TaxID=110536 RepID=A0ACC2J769_9PEZI|nr:hypothetical protein ONZ43_g741 [Nemania bipapillata]